jgi:hypothetical protein
MDIATQIAALERLYALPSREEKMSAEPNLKQLAAKFIAAAENAGTDGPWCYGCGVAEAPISACTCAHPENFSCHGHKFCCDCIGARNEVASYVAQMFRMKASDRVDSRKSRSYRFLTAAAEGSGLRGQALEGFLHRFADPRDDSSDDFAANVLRAFRRSRFFDFRTLTSKLREEENDFLVVKVIQSGVVGRVRVILASAGEEFYE